MRFVNGRNYKEKNASTGKKKCTRCPHQCKDWAITFSKSLKPARGKVRYEENPAHEVKSASGEKPVRREKSAKRAESPLEEARSPLYG